MKTATYNDLIIWHPCWLDEAGGEERLCAAVAHMPECFTALDVLGLDGVSAADRLWVALRPELLSYRTLRLFACDCAERALTRERAAGREPDARSWTAVAVARRHAMGEATDVDLLEAYRAAYAAYADTSTAAAAAYAAANAAAYAASDATSASAATASAAAHPVCAYASAYAAEREAQIAALRRTIEENE